MTGLQDSPPPIASLSDQRLQDGEEEEEEQQPKGVQEEAAARRRMSLARQMKEKRNQQLNQVKNKVSRPTRGAPPRVADSHVLAGGPCIAYTQLSKAIHAISKSKTRNSPRLHRVEQQQQPRQKPAMPAREKENLRLKLESEVRQTRIQLAYDVCTAQPGASGVMYPFFASGRSSRDCCI